MATIPDFLSSIVVFVLGIECLQHSRRGKKKQDLKIKKTASAVMALAVGNVFSCCSSGGVPVLRTLLAQGHEFGVVGDARGVVAGVELEDLQDLLGDDEQRAEVRAEGGHVGQDVPHGVHLLGEAEVGHPEAEPREVLLAAVLLPQLLPDHLQEIADVVVREEELQGLVVVGLGHWFLLILGRVGISPRTAWCDGRGKRGEAAGVTDRCAVQAG